MDRPGDFPHSLVRRAQQVTSFALCPVHFGQGHSTRPLGSEIIGKRPVRRAAPTMENPHEEP